MKRKTIYSSVNIILVMLFSLLSLRGLAQTTLSVDKAIHQAVKTSLNQEMKHFARANHWQHYRTTWDIWIPGAASHLKPCRTSLIVSSRDHQTLPVGHLKRLVSCQDTGALWKILVTIKASLTLPVVVTQNALNRGDTVKSSMLKLEKRTLTRETPFLTHPDQAINKTVNRRLRAGQMIDPSQLENPPLVMKGNEVVIMAVKYGVNASTKGIALETGAQGDQIKVQNRQTEKIIRAIVTGINEVHTQF